MTIKTVLFDFDGTLADSNELIAVSHLHVLEKYFPGKYNRQSVLAFNGPSLDEVYREVYPEKSAQLVAEYREFNHYHHDDYLEIFPMVAEVLVELKKQGIKLAVVSTKARPLLNHGLNLLGIHDYFDIILGGDDYQHPKPNPEPLLLAMEKLSATAETTIMVGDNWQDLEAAKRAKVRSVFVRWSEKTAEEMNPYSPDKIAETMVELLEWILTENNGGN